MVLVFDIGTSIVKAGLFSLKGQPEMTTACNVSLLKGETALHHEVDPREWITALSELCRKIGVGGSLNIRAIVVSGNGPTLLPVSADGAPLANAMTWMDRRGVEEAEIIKESCGMYVDPTFYLPKALWIKRQRPEIFEKTKYFFSCPEYIDFFLTGNAVTALPGDHFLRYFWTEELLQKLDLDPALFPPFIKPGNYIGKVTAKAEKATGIPSGIPVVSGGPDFIMSLLGAGSVAPGRACVRSGTSEGVNLCWNAPVEDERLMCYGHVVQGLFNVSGIISTSGKALEWYKNSSSDLSYEELFHKIEEIPPGSGGLLFLPYLTGERAPLWDPHARGAFIGLSLRHGHAHMARAVAESIGFAIRHVVEVMEEDGLTVEDLRITGRPSKSPVWNQIKADISGRRILLPEQNHPELSGDTCIALAYLGEYGSPAEASESIVTFERVFTPADEPAALYDTMFKAYRDAYSGLKTIFHTLSVQEKKEKP